MYFTPYRGDSDGRDSIVVKFRRGEIYDDFVRLFDQLWNASQIGDRVNDADATET